MAKKTDGQPVKVAGIILAAGMSRRLGQNKLLLPWGKTTVLAQVLDNALAAEKLNKVVLVLGYQSEEVKSRLGNPQLCIIENPAYEQGQSTSLRAGLAAVPKDWAALFLLGDQPLIRAEIIDELISAWQKTPAKLVIPVDETKKRGNPVLFSPSLRPELEVLRGDQGGRLLLEKYKNQSLLLPVEGKLFADIDTWEDYEEIIKV